MPDPLDAIRGAFGGSQGTQATPDLVALLQQIIAGQTGLSDPTNLRANASGAGPSVTGAIGQMGQLNANNVATSQSNKDREAALYGLLQKALYESQAGALEQQAVAQGLIGQQTIASQGLSDVAGINAGIFDSPGWASQFSIPAASNEAIAGINMQSAIAQIEAANSGKLANINAILPAFTGLGGYGAPGSGMGSVSPMAQRLTGFATPDGSIRAMMPQAQAPMPALNPAPQAPGQPQMAAGGAPGAVASTIPMMGQQAPLGAQAAAVGGPAAQMQSALPEYLAQMARAPRRTTVNPMMGGMG